MNMGDTEGNSGNKTVAVSGDGVTINIRCSNGVKFAVKARLELTVEQFKTLVSQNCDIPANQQRLIYKGRILKDDQTLDSYGLQDEHTVHLVRGFVPDKSANSTSAGVAAPGGENSTPDIPRGGNSAERQGFGGGLLDSLFPGVDGSALGGSGASSLFGDGLPGFEQIQQQVSRNPNMINEMLNMPGIQNLLDDPDIIRSFLMNNPRMREVIDRNPELAHVLNDPNTLRQTMETARNPELMREMMRNTDRAMSNIESLPEGFNMLRRMYENVQEPLLSATSMTGDNGSGPGSNPLSALLGNPSGMQVGDRSTTPTINSDANSGSSIPNANPLPNPWRSDAATHGSETNNTSENHGAGANVRGVTGLGPALSGIDAQMDPAAMIQLMQSTDISQIMNQVINMDPQLRGLVDSYPQLQQAMENPDLLLNQMPSAERLQQAMASLSSMFGSQQSPLGTGQTVGGGASVPPEELYADQLIQLQEMGFIDTRENIQALLATSGNVNAAVERLLQNLGQ